MKEPHVPVPDLPVERRALVRAIVIDQGEVLIVQRSADESFMPDIWQFPAGGVEMGEHPEWALRRELREETGIEADHVQIVSSDSFWAIGQTKQEDWSNFNFLAVPHNRKVILSEEHQAHAWVPISLAAEKLQLPEDLAALHSAIHLQKTTEDITRAAGLL